MTEEKLNQLRDHIEHVKKISCSARDSVAALEMWVAKHDTRIDIWWEEQHKLNVLVDKELKGLRKELLKFETAFDERIDSVEDTMTITQTRKASSWQTITFISMAAGIAINLGLAFCGLLIAYWSYSGK